MLDRYILERNRNIPAEQRPRRFFVQNELEHIALDHVGKGVEVEGGGLRVDRLLADADVLLIDKVVDLRAFA